MINLTRLKPEDLMVIPVTIEGKEILALIDSGATNNFVKSKVVSELGLEIADNEVIIISGLGDSEVKTLGRIDLGISLLGRVNFNTSQFNVIADNAFSYDIILGRSYLKDNKLIIDMSKSKISKMADDGSRVDFYMRKDGKVISIIHEDIPVYAKDDVNVKNKEIMTVPIIARIISGEVIKDRSNYYYEGKIKNKKIRGVDGIISCLQDDPVVMIMNNLEQNNVTTKIRKGEKIGKISTLIELEPEEVESENINWSKEDIINKIDLGTQLSKVQKEQVSEMLLETQDVMSKNDKDIGKAAVNPHIIQLTDRSPIWQKPRKFSEPINQEIDRQCNELLELDIIEYSNSQWASPVVPVRKKNGELRMCIDYRKLNSVTKTDKFPMPNLSESIYSAYNTNYFTKLDLIKGYYQVPLEEESRKFTAFSTPHNHYQFKRLSFGLKNSGIAFQKNMQQILSEYTFNNVLVYIDDILIMSEKFEEHVTLVRNILNTLKNSGIKIKVGKCEFFKSEVTFLGHLIGKDGIKKSPEFIQKIKEYPKPTTVTELRQFLGLANFQRKFVEQCSAIGKPLSELTGGPKKKVLTWTNEMTEAYNVLKTKLIEDVVLSFPDYTPNAEKLQLFVDASGIGAGGCLVQKQGGEYKTIGYSSMTFSDAETRYSTIERELVAIRWGVKAFRPFLFGVSFTLYTDHKPLIYLQNMARENSRLMRTINELGEYDFVIKYRPGSENCAADAMSRIVKEPSNEEYARIVDSKELPSGLQVLKPVEGGGNSFFQSLLICLNDVVEDSPNLDIPENHLELREELVTFVIENAKLFKMKLDRELMKKMKAMKNNGQLPCEELLLAACRLYSVEIWVHHGMTWPVIYKVDRNNCSTNLDISSVIHLQCISGIHFNPVFVKNSRKVNVALVKKEYINGLFDPLPEETKVRQIDEIKESVVSLINVHTASRQCVHEMHGEFSCIINVGNIKFCALVDTGAQVSLISDRICRLLREEDSSLVVHDIVDRSVSGINNSKTSVLGILNLKPRMLEFEVREIIPFAVVNEADMPCCCILGANFLARNEIVVDFAVGSLYVENDRQTLLYPLISKNLSNSNKKEIFKYDVSTFFGTILIDNSSDTDEDVNNDMIEVSDDEKIGIQKVRFLISKLNLINIQNEDTDMIMLKAKITSNIANNLWEEEQLTQFKRHQRTLRVENDLLLRDHKEISVPVVPYNLLIDIVYKVHTQMAHIGRHKLINIVSRSFWHPALDKVAGDICISCNHCQLYKVSSQPIAPPTIKIHASHPFDLVAMDLLQFPKSSRNNVAALVVIDHYSKFLIAIPLKDKTAITVTKALNEQVLPHMLRIPNRVLTDNGPEFRSSHFNDALNNYNIDHIYSTRYRASGNGAVERSNRTVTELLKGLINENPTNWDVRLNKALIIYNTTWHSQINSTPTDYILQVAHNFDNIIPIDSSTISNWKEAHPKFSSFEVKQKVAHKINKIGNQLKYKLGRKFEGPFEITKVQSNGVSYEVKDGTGKILKVHHKQLKLWNEPPDYIKKYLALSTEKENNNIVNMSADDSTDSSEAQCGAVIFSSHDSSSNSTSSSEIQRNKNIKYSLRKSRNRSKIHHIESSHSNTYTDSDTSGRAKSHTEDISQSSSSGSSRESFVTSSAAAFPSKCGGKYKESSSDSSQSKGRTYNNIKGNQETRRKANSLHLGKSESMHVQLELLHCSEPVVWPEVRDKVGEGNVQIAENGLLNQSIGSSSFIIKENNAHSRRVNNVRRVVKVSSPISDYVEVDSLGIENISPIIHQELHYSNDKVDKSTNTKSDVEFLQWIEQSIGIQEELVDKVVETEDVVIQASLCTDIAREGDKVGVAPERIADESFHGFGEESPMGKYGSANREALRILKDHLKYVRGSIAEYRGANELLCRECGRRYMCSESRVDIGSGVETEASDMAMELPQIDRFTPGSQRITRSRGAVESYPNVQRKTLEYKSRGD
jgi:transposase InsO family protein